MDAKFIDRLREAAKEYGAVADLLAVLDSSLLIDEMGNKEIVGDDDDISVLKDALIAAQFSAFDREKDHG